MLRFDFELQNQASSVGNSEDPEGDCIADVFPEEGQKTQQESTSAETSEPCNGRSGKMAAAHLLSNSVVGQRSFGIRLRIGCLKSFRLLRWLFGVRPGVA